MNSMEEYQRLYRLSLDDPEGFWGEQAETLDWFHPWHIACSTPTTRTSTSPGTRAAG